MALTSKIDAIKQAREQFEREFQERLKQLKAEEEALVKAAETGEKLVAAVSKFDLDPSVAYEILMEAGLIEAPVLVTQTTKAPIIATFTNPPAQPGGRSTTLNIYQGDDVNAYVGRNKGLWAKVFSQGYDYFLSGLTASGKAWVETDAGRVWLQAIFK